MSLYINHLKLIVVTKDGDYGVDIPIKRGLFVLRVENTHGKSTCMNAIAYALGMEQSLGLKGAKLPFPPSLTKSIEGSDGVEHDVISSRVYLEIENDSAPAVTLMRHIVGGDGDGVIHHSNFKMDKFFEGTVTKYFIHKEGDTTRALGFYKWLSDYLSWSLPQVPTQQSVERPLYPSTFFPLLFVEQKKGWSSIQATTPMMYGIKDVKKRTLEFMLSLDINEAVKKKAKLQSDILDIQELWSATYKKAEYLSATVSGHLSGVSEKTSAKFDPYKLSISTKYGEDWEPIQNAIDRLKEQLKIIDDANSSRRSIASIDHEIQVQVDKHRSELSEIYDMNDELENEISFLSYQLRSTHKRVKSLSDDKRKYEDLKKIGELEILASSATVMDNCPTCGQEIGENLVDLKEHSHVMSIEESLNFIREQIKTFKSATLNYRSQLDRKHMELKSKKERVLELASDIGKLLDSRSIPLDTLAEDKLREKIRLESLLETYTDTVSGLYKIRLDFDSIHRRYKDLITLRRKQSQNDLTSKDRKKLRKLQVFLRELLSEYGFSSFDPKLLEISEETYLPTREGFDIGFDTSASDGIRIIWSYLIGLFQLSFNFDTNHPQLLIFDEPRQQEANEISFTSLLSSVADICKERGQIIFATSEEKDSVLNSLKGKAYTLHSFDKNEGKIIRKIE